jgi:hypothetical protein
VQPSRFRVSLIGKQINMKKYILIAAAVIFSATTVVVGQSRETRNVGSFTRVDFGLPGKLHIKQGSADKVEISADKDILSDIETKVEGSKLVIRIPGKWNWSSDDDDIEVFITIKNLEGLYASGSGDVVGESKFSTNDLDLKVSGSGSLKIDADAKGDMDADVSGSGELQVNGSCRTFKSNVSGSGRVNLVMDVAGKSDFGISGSGKIQASGKSDGVDIAISGSGKVLGADFQTARCDVRISGSGNVEINVTEELDSHISGSGNVSYKGNPSKVNNHASGSGSVRKM